ncbi:MAG TPA: hypothetical protein QGF58_09245 [Myxococcota bacterium]|nr:hypothetical protein [Myxococcota bacterium]
MLLLLSACMDQGVHQLYATDSWTQGDARSPIDVLWVVDDSATMFEEQDQLADHADAFVQALDEAGVDFQVGVTTTDVDADAGALRGPVLKAGDADLVDDFAEQVLVGVQGSRDEQPLYAASLATSEPWASTDNADLVREVSYLAVVVVTDEDDHSEGPVTDYLDDLESLGHDFGLYVVAGGLPEGCSSALANAVAAERLLETVERSEGQFRSICAADFEPVMRGIGLGAAGMSDTFPLQAIPAPESLQVRVEGLSVEMDEDDGWTYEAALNAIVFHGGAVPQPGTYIFVKYIDYGNRDIEQEG